MANAIKLGVSASIIPNMMAWNVVIVGAPTVRPPQPSPAN
jgi:hypothetical protein